MKKLIFLIVFLLGFSLFSGSVFAFYSSTAAYQELNTSSTNVSALSYRVQGIASSTVNTFVEQIWKLKFKATINNRLQVNFYWNGGTSASFLDFQSDLTVIASTSQPEGYEPTSLTKDGDFYTIAYPAFQPTGDVYLQFRPLTSSADIYGTNTNNYNEGAFCVSGNNPYTLGCPPSPLIDAYFILSIDGEVPPKQSVSIRKPEVGVTTYSTDPLVIIDYDFAGEETEGLLDLEVRLGDATTTIIEQQKAVTGEAESYVIWLNNSYYLASETIRGQATTTVIMYVDLWNTAETELYAQASSTYTVLNQFFVIEGIGTTTDIFFVDCSMYGEAGFFSSTTIPRIGCEAKKIGYDFAGFMILPQKWATDLVGSSYEALKNKFPFSIVFSLSETVKTGAETASESTSTAPLVLTYPGNKLTLEILSTSTLDFNATSTAVMNMVFTGIEYILWAVCGLMILKLII